MARRVHDGVRGEYLPQVADGIRADAAHLSSSFEGIGTRKLDLLEAAMNVPMSALDVWSVLFRVDEDEAEAFARRNGGRPLEGSDQWFEYQPAIASLRRCAS